MCLLVRYTVLKSDQHLHSHYWRAWNERPLVLSCHAYRLAMERDRREPWRTSCRAIRPSVKKWSIERWDRMKAAIGVPWKSSSHQRRLASQLEQVSAQQFSPHGIDLESSSPNVPCTMCRDPAYRGRCPYLSYHIPNVKIFSIDSSDTSHAATDDTTTIKVDQSTSQWNGVTSEKTLNFGAQTTSYWVLEKQKRMRKKNVKRIYRRDWWITTLSQSFDVKVEKISMVTETMSNGSNENISCFYRPSVIISSGNRSHFSVAQRANDRSGDLGDWRTAY